MSLATPVVESEKRSVKTVLGDRIGELTLRVAESERQAHNSGSSSTRGSEDRKGDVPMESKPLPRKLAAIPYADVVGYSRLTGKDEDAALDRI